MFETDPSQEFILDSTIWIGPIVSDKVVGEKMAISPAANKWQISFIEELRLYTSKLLLLSYIPQPVFPRGPLLEYYTGPALKTLSCFYNPYVNVKGLKSVTLASSLFLRCLLIGYRPKIIFTYNDYPAHHIFAKACRRFFNAKWINIVADDKGNASADISLFLSYFAFLSSSICNRIHFDGGVYGSPEKCSSVSDRDDLIVLFAGALNEWTGIIELVNWVKNGLFAFNPRIKLKIYGKGCVSSLKAVADNHPQVQIVGFVDTLTLDQEMRNCWLFINPRPIGIKGGEFNFPSKLFDYMRFGKPILCTPTPGLAPEYLNVFVTYATKEQLRIRLEELSNASTIEFENISERHYTFASSKTWRAAVEVALSSVSNILKSNFEGFGLITHKEKIQS